MITLEVPYKINKFGDKIVGINMTVAYFEIDRIEKIERMHEGMHVLYNQWFTENGITSANFQVNIEYEKDDTCTIISIIQFEKHSDAMAFRLRWL